MFPKVEDITPYEPPVQCQPPIVEDLESESESEVDNFEEAVRIWEKINVRYSQMIKTIMDAGGEKNLTAEQLKDIDAGFRENSFNRQLIANLGFKYSKIKKLKELKNKLVKKQKLKRKCDIYQPPKILKELEFPT